MTHYKSAMCTLIIAVVLWSICTPFSNIRKSLYVQNSVFNDITITSNIISSVSDVITDVNCGMECTKKPNCWSFSHHGLNHTCRLHSQRFTNVSGYLPVLGWRHYFLPQGSCPGEDGYVLMNGLNLCFNTSFTYETWYKARDICRESGSRLIVLDTEAKHKAITDYIKAMKGKYSAHYIGLTRKPHENTFFWEDGNPVDLQKWRKPRPKRINKNNKDTCTELWIGNSKWNYVPCTFKRKYICEKHI